MTKRFLRAREIVKQTKGPFLLKDTCNLIDSNGKALKEQHRKRMIENKNKKGIVKCSRRKFA